MTLPGVAELVLVRHGESVGNVAARDAALAGADVIDLATRDPDTPLSALGERQAAALGTWLGGQPGGGAPGADRDVPVPARGRHGPHRRADRRRPVARPVRRAPARP